MLYSLSLAHSKNGSAKIAKKRNNFHELFTAAATENRLAANKLEAACLCKY